MDVFLRNITTDEDVEVSLPMDSGKLKELTGKDEWIIADSPVGEEFTSILMLNELVKRFGEENLMVLAEVFLLSEIEEKEPDDFVIIDFDSETACYNDGNGFIFTDWEKGFALHDLGYVDFPFKYTDEMEGYVKFEQLWYTAESSGWNAVIINGRPYLVCKN